MSGAGGRGAALSFAHHVLTGKIRRYSPAAYRKAIADRVRLLKRYPEITAVYLVGNISTHGISDIDFLIVLADDPQQVNPHYDPSAYSIRHLSPQHQYLFLHEEFAIPEALAADVGYLFYFPEMRKLSGKIIAFDQRRYRSNANLLSLFLEGLFVINKAMYEMLAVRELDRRAALSFLKSFLYTIDLCNHITGKREHPRASAFRRAVTELRATYFRTPQQRSDAALRALLNDLLTLIPLLLDAVQPEIPFPVPAQRWALQYSVRIAVLFLPPAAYRSAVRHPPVRLPFGAVTVPAPTTFAAYFCYHGLIQNACGQRAAQLFGKPPAGSFHRAIEERCAFLTRYTDFLYRYHLQPYTLFGYDGVWVPAHTALKQLSALLFAIYLRLTVGLPVRRV